MHHSNDSTAAVELLSLAYDREVNFFGNAEAYTGGESERIMARALRKPGFGRDTYSRLMAHRVGWN